jgi:hypothetical protein
VDDQRSAWSPRGRLTRIEERLERLQKTVGTLNALLKARPKLGEDTAQGGWGALAFPEGSNVAGRGDVLLVPGARSERAHPALRPIAKPPRDRDPIGCVETGIERLAEDIRGLFRTLDAPVPDDGPRVIPPRYTGPSASDQGPRSGDQTDSGTGDDTLSDLDPSKGPGGSGPYAKKRVNPEDEGPRFGPGF